MTIQTKDKMKNKNIKPVLRRAMSSVTNDIPSITYAILDTSLIVLFFDFTGPRAQKEAKACASNWWRSVNTELNGNAFYFEVGCTWLDDDKTPHLEKVTTFNFPHMASKLKAHQISFEEPPKGTKRQS